MKCPLIALMLLSTCLHANPPAETPTNNTESQEPVEKPVFTPWVEPELDLGLCDS
ncbi:hypothetical protein [Marinospirillum alkaliphilum]|uniref:Uncharacterized protein n=1 Tax=Marinospirillum alkaliphilum DSM 21637 TaxID=1122209 RepID=A0A1K1ZL77_9GAMM|nr:hypothetical protein [Marinospirillum alkaliphilum]SFX74832.1 hypothetical protein SAMN02745752_02738 [Marinospirillum alkaliphilum DSM 21637]